MEYSQRPSKESPVTLGIRHFAEVWAGDHERRLYAKLADGYNKLARPVRNESEPVLVLLGLDFQQILDIVGSFVGHICPSEFAPHLFLD